QELGPKASNSKVTFAVSPLAGGRLSGSRVQILHQGRVLEEIRTPIRGTSLRTTVLFGFLTLLALAYLFSILGPLPDLSRESAADRTAKPPAAPPMEGVAATAPTSKEHKPKISLENTLLEEGKLPDYLKKEELPEDMRSYLSQEALAEQAQDAYNFLYKI